MNINIPDKIDINRLGENITLDSTEDKVSGECEYPELASPDFSKMFQTCSVISEIKDGNVLFTDGTAIPLSQILETDPSLANGRVNLGAPMHDPPFPTPKPENCKPSYIEVDERLDTYKKIFLTVIPIFISRASYPYNFDRIIEFSNELTVKTMRQFTKLREYYSEHI